MPGQAGKSNPAGKCANPRRHQGANFGAGSHDSDQVHHSAQGNKDHQEIEELTLRCRLCS
jgi:hypothetical protein